MFKGIFQVCKSITIEIVETTAKFIEIIEYEIEYISEIRKLTKIKHELKKKMMHASSYTEWKAYAGQFDSLKGII